MGEDKMRVVEMMRDGVRGALKIKPAQSSVHAPYLQMPRPGRPIYSPQPHRPVFYRGRGFQGRVRRVQDLALQRVHADRGFQEVAVKGRGGGDVQGGEGGGCTGSHLGQQVGEADGEGGQGGDVRELKRRKGGVRGGWREKG